MARIKPGVAYLLQLLLAPLAPWSKQDKLWQVVWKDEVVVVVVVDTASTAESFHLKLAGQMPDPPDRGNTRFCLRYLSRQGACCMLPMALSGHGAKLSPYHYSVQAPNTLLIDTIWNRVSCICSCIGGGNMLSVACSFIAVLTMSCLFQVSEVIEIIMMLRVS